MKHDRSSATAKNGSGLLKLNYRTKIPRYTEKELNRRIWVGYSLYQAGNT